MSNARLKVLRTRLKVLRAKSRVRVSDARLRVLDTVTHNMDMIFYTNANSAPTLQSILRTSAMSAETQMPISSPTTSDVWPGYTCLFSQLPGELRNRIYDCILEDEPASMIWVNYKPNPAMPFQERYPKHQYVGLTQVDRTTRAEFSPLYTNARYFHFS